MNRNARLLIVLFVAIAAAGIASFAAYRAIQNLPVKQVEVGSVPAVVATRALPVGTLLTKDDVKVVAWPERAPVPGAFATIDGVVNRGLVVQVAENEPITESQARRCRHRRRPAADHPAGHAGDLAQGQRGGRRRRLRRARHARGRAGHAAEPAAGRRQHFAHRAQQHHGARRRARATTRRRPRRTRSRSRRRWSRCW